MRFAITAQGRLFLVVMALLSLASFTSQSTLLLLPVGILLGCYLVNGWVAARTVSRLRIEAPGITHLAEGQRMSQPWRLVNEGRHSANLLELTAGRQTLLRLSHIAAQATAHGVPELLYLRRGVYALNDLRLGSGAPFGLIRADRPLELDGEVIVHPAVYHATPPLAAGFDVVVGGKYRGHRQSPAGALFAGIRPFQPGDPFKHVHWKSSARGQDLMVKTFDEELSGRVAVIVDAGHTGDAGMLDDALRAAGSLMFAALDEGHQVEWIALDGSEPSLVPPFADGQEMLEALARVRLSQDCLSEAALDTALAKLSPRAAVCLVVTRVNEAVRKRVSELLAERRKVSLYFPAADPFEEALAGLSAHRFTSHQIDPVT